MTGRGTAWLAGMIVSTVLAVVLIVVAAVLVVSADREDRAATAVGREAQEQQARRDTVATAAGDGTTALNTVDFRTVDRDLDRAEAATTGAMLTEYRRQRPAFRAGLVAAAAVVQTRVVAAGLERDDPTHPVVLVALDVRASSRSTAPTSKEQAFDATMTLVGDRWLISTLQPVQGVG